MVQLDVLKKLPEDRAINSAKPVWQPAANVSRKLSFCFVSETSRVENPLLDPSVRYRCYHPAEFLSNLGHACTVVSAQKYYARPALNHDVFIFHRPNVSRSGFTELMRGLSGQGAVLIADYDDLIFGDSDIAAESSIVKNGTMSEDAAINVFRNNLQALGCFDKVITSTSPLSEFVRQYNPHARVHVSPNFIPESIYSLHKDLETPYRVRPETTIGYFAGTKSHDKDLPIVEPVLHRVLSENPHFRLLVVGPVKLPRGLVSLPNVTVASVVNYMRLPGLMSGFSTVIAPLEKSTFNACKSRVKFLESALAGCRLVASAIPDMKSLNDGSVVLADSLDDWYEALSNTLEEPLQRTLAESNFTSVDPAKYQSFSNLIPANFLYEDIDIYRAASGS